MSRLSLGLLALVLASSSAASAEPRSFADLEPVTLEFASGAARTQIFTAGFSYGAGSRTLVPYVGGAVGFFLVQARAGVAFLPAGFDHGGLMMRLEARPMAYINPCLEPALFGTVGIGYRGPLETSYPGEHPGAGFYVLPSLDGGEAWIRPGCSARANAPVNPREPHFFLGGTLAAGLDW